jgi:predicted dehydrogenase
LRAGRLPTEPGWGAEPPSSWGTVGTPGEVEAVETVAGAYQRFYDGVARMLLDGAPPPVDVADAVTGLEVIEAALRSDATRSVVTI